MNKCLWCGKKLHNRAWWYCSNECVGKDKIGKHKEKYKEKQEYERCRMCDIIFLKHNSVQIYCSKKCRNNFLYPKKIKKLKTQKNVLIKKHKRICSRCKINSCNSTHHIFPREFGGGNNKENKIRLCRKCHDIVEIETHNLFKMNKIFDSKTLRGFIINNNFPNYLPQIDLKTI